MKIHDHIAAQEVINTVEQYAWSFDSNDMALMATLFHEQGRTSGVITGTEMGWGPWTGAQTIAQELGNIRDQQTDTRRHVLTTPIFHALTEEHAELRCNLCLYASENGEASVLVTTGEYTAKLSKKDGIWKLDDLHAVLDAGF